VAPRITREADNLISQIPQLTEKFASGQIAYSVGSSHGWSYETQQRIQHFLATHQQEILSAFQGLVSHAASAVQNFWWLILVPILAVFFLLNGSQFRSMIVTAADRAQDRHLVSAIVSDMDIMLGHFIRAQLALAVLAMLVLTLIFWAMRVPYTFALGPVAGALEFIPVVGPIMGACLVLAIAFVSSYSHLLITAVVLLIWRGIQDYVTSPRVMGSKLKLHPLAVLFGVLAGGEVGGVIGVFLSIPVLAAGRILWRAWRTSRSIMPTSTPASPSPILASTTAPKTPQSVERGKSSQRKRL
jgi:predicted PurR-regulated permease PerM